MGICWYCYWGWPKPVAEIYLAAVKMLNGNNHVLHYGPSHIVWEDENFDCAEWCIEHFDEYTDDHSDEELAVVKWSLEELAKLPVDQRDIVPDDYDGMNPEDYPPDVEVVRM